MNNAPIKHTFFEDVNETTVGQPLRASFKRDFVVELVGSGDTPVCEFSVKIKAGSGEFRTVHTESINATGEVVKLIHLENLPVDEINVEVSDVGDGTFSAYCSAR